MARAIVLMMDSLGIGASADADEFGDQGVDTLGHIADIVLKGGFGSTELREDHWSFLTFVLSV